jgi:putative peptide zinc metalloprotease protein
VDPGKLVVRVAIPQSDIGLIRNNTRDVELRISGFSDDTISGVIQHQVPSATDRLPSPALGTRGGGLLTNNSDDTTGLITTDDIFLVDIGLPDNVEIDLVGTRVHVRFEHEPEPVAYRIYRQIQQLLLRRLTI